LPKMKLHSFVYTLVPDEKVRTLFADYASIQVLQEEDIIDREQSFQKLGCAYVYERVYLIDNGQLIIYSQSFGLKSGLKPCFLSIL